MRNGNLLSRITTVCQVVYAGAISDYESRLGNVKPIGDFRRFLVARLGSTGSTWFAKLLNSHADVYCSHEAIVNQIYPATAYTHQDVLRFIEAFAADNKHQAYLAVGDVGSVWSSHLPYLRGCSTAILIRHPARVLKSRLAKNEALTFTPISAEAAACLREIWGVDMQSAGPAERVFLNDVFNFAAQARLLQMGVTPIRLEDMQDEQHCAQALKTLTGLDYDLDLIRRSLATRINARFQDQQPISEIVERFSRRQKQWYELILADLISDFGYNLTV